MKKYKTIKPDITPSSKHKNRFEHKIKIISHYVTKYYKLRVKLNQKLPPVPALRYNFSFCIYKFRIFQNVQFFCQTEVARS